MPDPDVASPILEAVRRDQNAQITRGFVVRLSGNSVYVRVVGAAADEPTASPRHANCTWPLVVGDVVTLFRIAGGYVVGDKLIG